MFGGSRHEQSTQRAKGGDDKPRVSGALSRTGPTRRGRRGGGERGDQDHLVRRLRPLRAQGGEPAPPEIGVVRGPRPGDAQPAVFFGVAVKKVQRGVPPAEFRDVLRPHLHGLAGLGRRAGQRAPALLAGGRILEPPPDRVARPVRPAAVWREQEPMPHRHRSAAQDAGEIGAACQEGAIPIGPGRRRLGRHRADHVARLDRTRAGVVENRIDELQFIRGGRVGRLPALPLVELERLRPGQPQRGRQDRAAGPG